MERNLKSEAVSGEQKIDPSELQIDELQLHQLAFVGGGIAPKILSRLTNGPFLDRFAAKGRFEATMRSIPVQVVLAPDVALLGAAACVANGHDGAL